MGRGMAHAALRQFRDAIDDFDRVSASSRITRRRWWSALWLTPAPEITSAPIEDLTAALKLQPEDVRAWRVRGAVRERLGDDDGAVADYSEAIQRDPKDARLYLARGAVYARMKRHQDALRDRDQAVAARSQESRRLRGARRLVP